MEYVIAALVATLIAYSVWMYYKGGKGASAKHERKHREQSEKSVGQYKRARGRFAARARRWLSNSSKE